MIEGGVMSSSHFLNDYLGFPQNGILKKALASVSLE